MLVHDSRSGHPSILTGSANGVKPVGFKTRFIHGLSKLLCGQIVLLICPKTILTIIALESFSSDAHTTGSTTTIVMIVKSVRLKTLTEIRANFISVHALS